MTVRRERLRCDKLHKRSSAPTSVTSNKTRQMRLAGKVESNTQSINISIAETLTQNDNETPRRKCAGKKESEKVFYYLGRMLVVQDVFLTMVLSACVPYMVWKFLMSSVTISLTKALLHRIQFARHEAPVPAGSHLLFASSCVK